MRDPAAIENGGWVRRFVAHSGATAIALIGHLAILFALGYDAASEVIVGELPAAITVEIVFAPADGARNVSDQSTAIEAGEFGDACAGTARDNDRETAGI